MTPRIRASTFRHLTATRGYLLRFLDEHPDEYGLLVEGAESFAEARAFIANGPAVHPVGQCDGFDYERGMCPGHERP